MGIFLAIILVSVTFVAAPFIKAQSGISANPVKITPVVISAVSSDIYQFTFITTPVAPGRIAFGPSSVAAPNPSANAYGYSSVTEFDFATTTQKTITIHVNRDVATYFRPVVTVDGKTYFGEEVSLGIFNPESASANSRVVSIAPAKSDSFAYEIDTVKDIPQKNFSANANSTDKDVISESIQRIWNWFTSTICPVK